MSEEKNLDEIILYHGSLAELNERLKAKGDSGRFNFADELWFLSEFPLSYSQREVITECKRQIVVRGYDGLVNMRTLVYPEPRVITYAIEGTPIVRVD